MAKDTVTARPGALKLAIRKAGFNQKAFAEKVGCSRTTLQTIDAGKQIKAETLRNIAGELRIPVTHLMAEETTPVDDGPVQIIDSEDDVFGTTVKLLLRRLVSVGDVRSALAGTSEIKWALNIPDIGPELEAALVEFEKRLVAFNTRGNMLPARVSTSLTELIESQKTQRTIVDNISQLQVLGAHVYGGRYICWERDDSGYEPRNEDYPGWVDYKSRRLAMIAIESNEHPTIRMRVHHGHPPPQFATVEEPRVKVDGVWLKTKEEFDEELSIYDENNFPF